MAGGSDGFIGTNGKAPEDESKRAYFRPRGLPIEPLSDPSSHVPLFNFVSFVLFVVRLKSFSVISAFSAVKKSLRICVFRGAKPVSPQKMDKNVIGIWLGEGGGLFRRGFGI